VRTPAPTLTRKVRTDPKLSAAAVIGMAHLPFAGAASVVVRS
jgi:hypothetical protein